MYFTSMRSYYKRYFVSDGLRKSAMNLGYSDKNSVIIPNGVDDNIFFYKNKKLAKKKLDIQTKKLIGFVGNLVEIKNVRLLPKIFREIKNKYKDVAFAVVGDGYEAKYLKEEFSKLKLDVYLTGRIKQNKVAEYMQAMDIMILPSRDEGFGSVIIEAQACGTYVCGSNVGGIPEAIGENGKVFDIDFNFIQKISNHSVEILKNGYNIDNIIERTKKYSWKNIAKTEFKVFENVLEKQGSKK